MRSLCHRLGSFGLILVLILTMTGPLPARAADTQNQCGDQLTWTLENGTLTIQGTGDMYPYAAGKAPWMTDVSSITRVQVLSGVSSVSDYAFYGCTRLKEAVLADSVLQLGYRIFARCSALTSVTLPAHITVIPYEAFINCAALAEIEIPNSVTSIGTDAFENCKSLTSIRIPDSVAVIGQYAFYGCYKLTSVEVGIGVSSMSYEAFASCPALRAVNVSPDNPYICSVDGVVYTKEKDVLLFRPINNGPDITIPASVLAIQSKALYENYNGVIHDSVLKNIYFEGNMPRFASDCLGGVTATIYYPGQNPSWAEAGQESYGGNLTWIPYDPAISFISMEDCQISLSDEITPWTGGACYPEVSVSYHGKTLAFGTHYVLDYYNNKEVGTATVTVTGRGIYTGSVTKSFTIRKADQTLELSIPDSTIEVGYQNKITAIGSRGLLYISFASDHPEIATVSANGQVTGIAPGTAVITVTSAGNENYLPLSKTLIITVVPAEEGPYDINRCQIRMTTGNQMYTGYPMKVYFTIMRGSTYLTAGKDYMVTCSNCTEAGTATALVTGIGNYTGSASFNYQIVPAGQNILASVSSETIELGEHAQITAEGIGSISYHSDNPEIAVVDENGKITGVGVGSTTIEVSASGDRNHNAARMAVWIKVVALENPELIPISDCKISLKTTEYVYDGTAKCPEASVSYENQLLTEGKDYVIQYKNNVNAGYPTATLVGQGAYTGSADPITYHINLAPQPIQVKTLSPLKIKVGESAKIEVSAIGRLTFFTSTENKSLEIGRETGIVTGLAAGSVEVLILASGTSNYQTGNAQISVQVYEPEKETQPTELETSATETQPTEPETSVTETTSKEEETSPVKPAKKLGATTITLSNASDGISISWNKVSGAKGYYVYRKQGSGSYKKIKTIKSGSTTKYKNPASYLKNGTYYTYYVRAYSGDVKGSYHSKSIYRLDKVSISSLTNKSGRKLLVKWTMNPKASGHQIQYSTSSTFASGNTSVYISNKSTAKTGAKTITSLTKGKTYYVRVRAYKKNAAGSRSYSAWSTKKYKRIVR